LKDKLKELIDKIGRTYYSDDILRTLQLVKVSRAIEVKNKISQILNTIKDKNLRRQIKRELKTLA